MRNTLYNVKEGILYLFRYPVYKLEHFKVDYDAYWVDKRGEGLGKLSHWQKQRADLALKHLPHDKSVSVVDVGCGDGAVLAYLKKRASLGRIIGMDVSSTALVKARAQGVETILVGNDLVAGIEVLPQIDYAILFEVLEHVPESEKFLQAVLAKTRYGVFFSFPNTGYLLHRLRFLFGRFPVQWRLHPSEHVRFWTYYDLMWWLKALGLTHYNIHTYEGVPFLNKLWPSLFAQGLLVYVPKEQS